MARYGQSLLPANGDVTMPRTSADDEAMIPEHGQKVIHADTFRVSLQVGKSLPRHESYSITDDISEPIGWRPYSGTTEVVTIPWSSLMCELLQEAMPTAWRRSRAAGVDLPPSLLITPAMPHI